jgi:hypothetical protein
VRAFGHQHSEEFADGSNTDFANAPMLALDEGGLSDTSRSDRRRKEQLGMNSLEGQVDPQEGTSDPAKPKAVDDILTEAARALASRPRGKRKKWSGYVNGERVWRGRQIELPGGVSAYCYGALRGVVVWSFHPTCLPGEIGEPLGWGALPQEAVRLVRNSDAQLLGRRKRGVRERWSEVKKASARNNGRKPSTPGTFQPSALARASR